MWLQLDAWELRTLRRVVGAHRVSTKTANAIKPIIQSKAFPANYSGSKAHPRSKLDGTDGTPGTLCGAEH